MLVPAAGADPVTGGKTVLKFDQATGEGFADMSIGIDTTGAAKNGKRGFSFPIKGGDINEGPKGTIDHRGGLAFFTEGGPGVKFTKFTVKIGKNKTKLFAKSGGAEVRFIDLDLSDRDDQRQRRHEPEDQGRRGDPGKAGAEVLTDTFDFPFRKGIPLGTVTVKASLTS